MEKIKIAELAIDVNGLTKDMKDTKKSIDDLVQTQKDLKKSGDTSSKTFIDNEAKLKSLKTEFNSQIKVLQNVTNAVDNLESELNKEVKSLAQAEANNKSLRKSRSNLNLETKEGQKQLQLINKKIDQNTKYMKDNQDAQVQNKMNVGNYTQSIREALGIERAHAAAMQIMIPLQSAYSMVVGKSTGALKLFKIALASTGIGLLVIALGSLVTYLTSTQEGVDKVNKVLTPLKEVVGTLFGKVQELGKAFFKLVTLDFKGFISDIKTIGSEIGGAVSKAIERGKEMERIQQGLNKSEAKYITQQAKLKKVFAEQKKISEDTNLTIGEREEAAKKAIKVQEEIRKGTVARLKQEAQLVKLKQMANDTSDEEKAQLATKLAEIDKALEEEASKTTEAQNKLNSIVKEGVAKRKAAREQAISDNVTKLEEELALYQEQQRLKTKTDEEELAQMRLNADKEKEILDYKLKNKLISETAYQTEKLKLDNAIREKEVENENKALDNIEKFNERKKALEDEIYVAGLESDQEKEEAKLQLEKEREEAELERLEVSAERKAELKNLLEEKYQQKDAAIKKKYGDKAAKEEADRDKAALERKRAIANARLDMASGLSNLLNSLNVKDAKAQIALLLLEKGIAAARIIQNTMVANAKAVAASPLTGGMPFVAYNNVMMGIGLANVAAQTVQGIGNITKGGGESGNTERLARGGVLSGPSHANGGIPTPYGELEGEEAVINKKSTAMYRPLLSAINEAGGGRKFASGGMLGTSGVSRSLSMVDYDMMAEKMAQANQSLPAPRVAVDEINSTQSRVQTIENRANF